MIEFEKKSFLWFVRILIRASALIIIWNFKNPIQLDIIISDLGSIEAWFEKISNSHRAKTRANQVSFDGLYSPLFFPSNTAWRLKQGFLVKVVVVVVVITLAVKRTHANRNGLTIPWRLFSKTLPVSCQVSYNCFQHDIGY